jgi:D-aminopeptidase
MTVNLITDVAGVRVGSAHDERLASGVTAVIFDTPAVASAAVTGGSPAVRDTALLEPEMTVEQVDAFVLSGGSAFGLDAAGGVMAYLAGIGRGFLSRGVRVPIVPGASLFDLVNGGDKGWGARPPYWDMGYRAAETARADFALGTSGAGYGANSFGLKGGLGSTSAVTERGFVVGALVAANPGGRVTRGATRHFLAAIWERDGEFGGHGPGAESAEDARNLRLRSDETAHTSLAVVATDAALPKAQVKRLAVMAQAGFALALRPALSPVDGDAVFAAATGRSSQEPEIRDLVEIGMLAAECVARSIARAVYEATSLPFPGALPSWRERFGG